LTFGSIIGAFYTPFWAAYGRTLAHILLVEKNKIAVQTEFPTFCERENGK
jgi:hypothetical protein